MEFLPSSSPAEIARRAREARSTMKKMTSEESWADMIRRGVINNRGEVTHLIGGDAEPEPDYQNWQILQSSNTFPITANITDLMPPLDLNEYRSESPQVAEEMAKRNLMMRQLTIAQESSLQPETQAQ